MIRHAWIPLAALLAFVFPLAHPYDSFGHDWEYFASLSWVTLSNWLGNASMHDPWACGGLDLLANPQARVWSPMGVLDVAFAPHTAHAVSWLIYAVLGVAGAYRLCRDFGAARLAAAVAAFTFIQSSYFALHYVEGHSTFAALQALPWVAVFARKLEQPKAQLGLCALLALFLADGAFYALIFSGYLALTVLAVAWPKHARPTRAGVIALMGLACIGVAKLLPILLLGARTSSQCDSFSMPPDLIVHALFDPRATDGQWGGVRFHEFGAYLGLGVTLCLLVARAWKLGLAALFWLWTATGVGGAFNPWRVHCALPLFNVAHVQSRLLVLVLVCVLLLVADALGRLAGRTQLTLAALLVLEAVLVRNYTFVKAHETFTTSVLPHSAISKTQWREVIEYGAKPAIYQREGVTSRTCYEPSVVSPVVEIGAPGASVERLIPGELVLKDLAPGIVTLNTAHLGGWVGAEILSKPGERLSFRADTDRVVLLYAPAYRRWVGVCLALGLFAFCLATTNARRR